MGKTIERAVARIASVRRLHSITAARTVGAIIIQEIYGGNLSGLRSKGPKDDSLRKLAAHPKLELSASTLWRSVSVSLLCDRLPELREPKHIGLGHFYAVLGLDEPSQTRLLRQAEAERWSRTKLEAAAATLRPGRVRTRQPEILRFAARLRRVAASPLPDPDTPLAEDALDAVETALRDLERWSSALRQRLDVVRGSRGVSR
jgi:hypothetical protein